MVRSYPTCPAAATHRLAVATREVVAALAILAVLVAILIPAVFRARLIAARLKCAHNLKEIGEGLHKYHDARGRFPHGTYNFVGGGDALNPPPYSGRQDRRCWVHDVLPFAGNAGIAQKFEAHMSTGASAVGYPLHVAVIQNFFCPSDPVSPKTTTFSPGAGTINQGFSGNYVGNAGSGYFDEGAPHHSASLDGVFFALSVVTRSDISDGLSNTALVGELVLTEDVTGDDARGRYFNAVEGGVLFSSRRPPNDPTPDQLRLCQPGDPAAPCVPGAPTFLLVRSRHGGGANVALADGSVRFVRDGIGPAVFRAAGTRAGNDGGFD